VRRYKEAKARELENLDDNAIHTFEIEAGDILLVIGKYDDQRGDPQIIGDKVDFEFDYMSADEIAEASDAYQSAMPSWMPESSYSSYHEPPPHFDDDDFYDEETGEVLPQESPPLPTTATISVPAPALELQSGSSNGIHHDTLPKWAHENHATQEDNRSFDDISKDNTTVAPCHITVTFRRSVDTDKDRRRLRRLHAAFVEFPGNDSFSIVIETPGKPILPYWTFDSYTSTDYTGQRGDNYQDTETYTQNGEQKTRTVTKTRWSSASGNVQRHFDDVPVPATKSVLPKYLERLNWDFGGLVSYEPAYLSGHKAQTYQVSLEEGFERFKQIAEQVIRSDIRQDIGGDQQQISAMDTSYSDTTFKHLLVPVYASAYKFNNKVYQVVINGRTGEVQGERPYSWIKIAALILAILFLILLIVLISSMMR
jgi:hypothetical protein